MSTQQQAEPFQPFQVSNVFEQNGKLFLKTFLIDDSVNGAKWGIVNEYIPKHIDKFVGRPFILTQTRTHPPEFYGAIREDYNDIQGTINRYLRAQEKYRIGTIRKVESSTGVISASSPSSSSLGANKNSGWVAYVEITDPAAIQAFKSGHVPKYVSPTVFRLKHEDPPDATTDFEPLHLAAVDVPAYSIEKAGIRGSCTGDLVTCSKQLAQASLSPTATAIEDCGFCVKGTLEGFQNQFHLNSSFVDSGVKQASELTENNDNASVPAQQNAPAQQVDTQKQEQSQQPQQTQQQQPTQTTPPIEPNTTGTGQPFTLGKVEPKKEEKAESESTKKDAGAESTKDKQSKNSTGSEVSELNKTVQAMLEELKELKSYKQNQEQIERSNKDAARRAKIESAIPENYADSPDERKKAVETLMHYSNDEQLDYVLKTFVAPTVTARSRAQPKSPLKTGIRNASQQQQQQSKQLTDFGTATATAAGVQQASTAGAAPAPADMHRMEQICSMSDLVTRYRTSDNSGGAF